MARGGKRSALGQRLLGPDPHTRIRVAMTGASALISALYTVLVLLLAWVGFARVDLTVVWAATTLLLNAGVLTSIRAGWTRQLADPALTQLQIRYAIVSTMVGYVLLGEARGISPAILSPVMMFGIFGLSARQMKANFVFALLCLAVGMGLVAWTEGARYRPLLELAYGVMFVLVLAGSTFVGLRIQHVRQRLQRQKYALGAALERINHLAAHDDLTGLLNRRRMSEVVQAERERCVRSRRPLVLALLDLDFFKLVNDRYGHAAGDAVLCAFAGRVLDNLRSTDVLARWGGEEFLLLLPETSLDGALVLLERVRREVAELCVETANGEISMTVSIGVAAGRVQETMEQVLEHADEALYQAKAQGRDRVVVYGGGRPDEPAPDERTDS
ncbi:MAG: GGDEF domain-containing protein [Simplicispira sp.]|nr:GGDEF domain-containing protein [Simplicispira sp.]